jgi:hypothetical protein
VKKISGNWKSLLKEDPTGWLLEVDNPSVRYFTLKDILERKENDPDVQDARKSIMTVGIVPRILEKQNEDGNWGVADNPAGPQGARRNQWGINSLSPLS